MALEQERGWQLYPLDGETGHAYMGIKDQQKIFVKKNASPFLAALSLERITPKLVWTRRTGDGDVLTAQEWCEGRELEANELNSYCASRLLYQVHTSKSLLKMLKKVGGVTRTAEHFLRDYRQGLPQDLSQHDLLNETLGYLEENLPLIVREDMVVCHGDLYRKNWLLSQDEKLYLVDWDSAMIADPAYDIGMLFSRYIPLSAWKNWLHQYGISIISPQLAERVKWYTYLHYLLRIKKNYFKLRYHEMNQNIRALKNVYDYFEKKENTSD